MATIGSLIVNLVANTSQFVSGLGKAKGETKSFASAITSGLSPVGLFGAGLGAVGLSLSAFSVVRKIASDMMEAEAATAQLAATFTSTGGAAGFTVSQIKNLADELERTTTIQSEVTQRGAAVLATFTSIKGVVFTDALKSAQDLSTVLGQDMQSSILQIGKALQDPIIGITALRRAGVSFTESQREQIKTLVETGDTMAAQKLILQELAKEFGGSAAAAAETFAGSLEKIRNRLGEIGEEAGGVLVTLGEWTATAREILLSSPSELGDVDVWRDILKEPLTPEDIANAARARRIIAEGMEAPGEGAFFSSKEADQIAKENAALQEQYANDVFAEEQKKAKELADFERRLAEENRALAEQWANDQHDADLKAKKELADFEKRVADENRALAEQAATDELAMEELKATASERFFKKRSEALGSAGSLAFLERGSAEAISAIKASGKDPLQSLDKTAQAQLAAQIEANRLFTETRDAIKDQATVTISG